MRFLNDILKKDDNDSKEIYDTNLDYKLFNPYPNDLSKKLME